MNMRCGICHEAFVVDGDIQDGQDLQCPHCNGMFTYRKPTRIEVPTGARNPRGGETPPPQPEDVPDIPQYKRNPKLHIIRPTNTVSSQRPETNSMVARVDARAKVRRMRKAICWIAVLLVVYIGVGLLVGLCLSMKIERKRKGVDVALSVLVADQLRVTDRMLAITGRTLDAGRSMLEEMREVLADRELNRLALTYMGKDWSGERSEFLGRIERRRKEIRTCQEEKSVLKNRIRELENRKRSLSHYLKMPSSNSRDRLIAISEINRQLEELKSSVEERDAHIKSGITGEMDEVVVKCRKETIVALQKGLADRLELLRKEELSISYLQTAFRWFKVWPVGWLVKIIRGEDNGIQ